MRCVGGGTVAPHDAISGVVITSEKIQLGMCSPWARLSAENRSSPKGSAAGIEDPADSLVPWRSANKSRLSQEPSIKPRARSRHLERATAALTPLLRGVPLLLQRPAQENRN